MIEKNNFIHLYIGDGKGKTTAAAGMAIRAAGWKMSVLFCQFLKSSETGELPVLESLDELITIYRPSMRHKNFLWTQSPDDLIETREDILKGWETVKEIISNKPFNMVIMDEVLDVLKCGFIDERDFIETVRKEPSDVVLTGREASSALMNIADYITRMTAVRHPFQTGISSRKGIEY